jgi:SAM-dependent methyltransferase
MNISFGIDDKFALSIEDLPTSLTYSVDWRFLVDIPSECQILIISGAYDGFGFPLYQMTGSKIVYWRRHELHPIKNLNSPFTTDIDQIQAEAASPPFQKHSFNLIVIPDGLPRKTTISTIIELLRPGGSIIFGFSNRLFNKKFLRNKVGISKSDFALKLTKWFSRTGMFEILLFGTIPNHLIPGIIFPLHPNLIKFALNRFYGNKIPKVIINMLTKPGITPLTLWFLPAYYLIATKNKKP